MTRKFIRRNWSRFSRLGKKRKKKQIWRRAKGRHNKVREKRKGYPIKVMIGFKKKQDERGLINNKKLIIINKLKDIEKINRGDTILIGKFGQKKKIEIAKKAKEKGIHIGNLNIKKILKKFDNKNKMADRKSAIPHRNAETEENKK